MKSLRDIVFKRPRVVFCYCPLSTLFAPKIWGALSTNFHARQGRISCGKHIHNALRALIRQGIDRIARLCVVLNMVKLERFKVWRKIQLSESDPKKQTLFVKKIMS